MLKFLLLCVISLSSSIFAQLNTELIGSLNPQSGAGYNDIWGYVDSSGNEYAIMGAGNGTSIISLIDPANPVEVAFFPGQNTVWRDMKVHENYAYVVSDQTNEGLTIIDLSQLPLTAAIANTVTTYFTRAHNIFIDNGYAYVIGTESGGGMHILDLADPVNPVRTAYYTASGYMHDVYVWNDTVVACAANSYDLVDVTDKNNPLKISESPVLPGIYAHSGWMTEDKRYFYATEEFNVRDITVWDLQDRTTWNLVIPIWQMPGNSRVHNLFIKDDYAHISYYGEGYVVLDISNPLSPILVGQYDTYFGPNGGFSGAWGCYPYLPSGLILISDTQTGLYVIRFTPNDVPPFITHGPTQIVDSIGDVTIRAIIVDNNSVDEALLYYRTIINNEINNWNLISPSGEPINGIYEFVIPGQEHLTKVEYYFGAVDDSGNAATSPAGGSGVSPPGNIPPASFYSYQVIIAGSPILYSFSPQNDTTINKNGQITFNISAGDTSGLELSYKWYRNGSATGNNSATYNYASLVFQPAPRTDSIRVSISNGYFSIEHLWNVFVEDATTGIEDDIQPLSFNLLQNFPNPFNPATQIKFSIPNEEFVNLSVFNMIGEKIGELVNGKLSPGTYTMNFNAENLSSGIYIAQITAGSYVSLIKMTLVK
jgi:choice-of-anchor B domain-containing protein